MTATSDQRTTALVMRQWEKLEQIKRNLIKQGLLNGDATPAAVVAKLREVIPPDLFT